jgi:excisionase family DNA binding protein
MSEEGLLTTEEVLDYLQVNLRTIYRLIKAGKLPAVRVGRLWRFRKKDIDAWLARDPSRGRDERPRILVVDDEPDVCNIVSKTLAMAEYDVHTVMDGPSAIEQLRKTQYDLLVTDLRMPGMDGLTLIREARRHSGDDLPVIIITAYSTEASAIEAINMGISGYLTKPFRLPRILSLAARALGEPAPTDPERAHTTAAPQQ